MKIYKTKYVVIFVLVLWLLIATASFWLAHHSQADAFSDAAQLGDMFGVVNALFSGLAFALLIHSNRVQQEEMRLTKEELEGQKVALENQVSNMSKQVFERTFFELIHVHNNNLNKISHSNHSGGSAIGMIIYNIFSFTEQIQKSTMNSEEAINVLTSSYNLNYRSYEQQLGHYFRHLYLIFKFIDEHNDIDHFFYARIIRAQLSRYELTLLFYNCMTTHGTKMKPFIEKYTIFKHLHTNDINLFDLASSFYADTAFLKSATN